MVTAVKNWYNRNFSDDPKKIFPESEYPVEFAFNYHGRDYYKFSSESNIPYERGLKTVIFYEENRMKMDLEYIQKHCKRMDELLTAQKINIYTIKALNDQMKERSQFAYDVNLLYKLASVVFFDKNENPKTYDFVYNRKKIDLWKEGNLANDFFFQRPLLELMPFLKDAEENFQEYSRINHLVNQRHLENLSTAT